MSATWEIHSYIFGNSLFLWNRVWIYSDAPGTLLRQQCLNRKRIKMGSSIFDGKVLLQKLDWNVPGYWVCEINSNRLLSAFEEAAWKLISRLSKIHGWVAPSCRDGVACKSHEYGSYVCGSQVVRSHRLWICLRLRGSNAQLNHGVQRGDPTEKSVAGMLSTSRECFHYLWSSQPEREVQQPP